MALSVARIQADPEQIHCPFSGIAVAGDDGRIAKLPSLLFVYYGDATLYAYVSETFLALLENAKLECHDGEPDDSPEEIAPQLDIESAFLLEVNTVENGVNTYGFIAPS